MISYPIIPIVQSFSGSLRSHHFSMTAVPILGQLLNLRGDLGLEVCHPGPIHQWLAMVISMHVTISCVYVTSIHPYIHMYVRTEITYITTLIHYYIVCTRVCRYISVYIYIYIHICTIYVIMKLNIHILCLFIYLYIYIMCNHIHIYILPMSIYIYI